MRIWDPKAWLLLGVLFSFSLVTDGTDRIDPVMQWHSSVKHLALVYRSAVFQAWFICMLLFAIYFPERAAWDRRNPRLKWRFYCRRWWAMFWWSPNGFAVTRAEKLRRSFNRFDTLRT